MQYEILTEKDGTRKAITWEGDTPEEACQNVADCLQVRVLAWREAGQTNTVLPLCGATIIG